MWKSVQVIEECSNMAAKQGFGNYGEKEYC